MSPTPLPESMVSLTYTSPSTAPHLNHAPVTPPAPNELLIEVRAAAINPVDIQLWGNPVIGFLAGHKEKGIGRDYAGRVVAVGEALKGKGWDEGVEVFGLMNRPVSKEDYLIALECLQWGEIGLWKMGELELLELESAHGTESQSLIICNRPVRAHLVSSSKSTPVQIQSPGSRAVGLLRKLPPYHSLC